jgi:hypothetical protein
MKNLKENLLHIGNIFKLFSFPDFKDKLVDRPEENLTTMKHILKNSLEKYPNQNALGTFITYF